MKAIIEHLIVAVIAVLMAWMGYRLMATYGDADTSFLFGKSLGWTFYVSSVSILTWMILYRMCRRLHWLVLPVMGAVSPVIGALLFFVPWFIWPFWVVWEYASVVFPVGVFTGFLVTSVTLPFRPRGVLVGNV